ncbi:MAG: DUF4065 domain-containing protein [Desulfovibrio sp.]|nr:DUF4065 domain-containing protein [Desulfovibrio sp.]
MYAIESHFRFGDSSNLQDNEKESIDAILGTYGEKTSDYLVLLTHAERPWKDARKRAGARCNEEIIYADMAEYYSGLLGE